MGKHGYYPMILDFIHYVELGKYLLFTHFSQWNALEVRLIGDQSDSCNIFQPISI